MPERPFRLDDRAALVFGAGSGIWRAIAFAFAGLGASVGRLDKSAGPPRQRADLEAAVALVSASRISGVASSRAAWPVRSVAAATVF
jgi:NAD(P)-dependent dehydrogenase (short-subunit alcohol dehydrogenase family)